jgi:hypothetical protein
MNRSSIITYLLHALIFFIAVAMLYGSVLSDWSSSLMGSGEDTMKNFFTFAYHIVHGDEWFWFSGMNHPFGEHLTFTDNQAPLALLLKLVNSLIPLEGQLVWILPLILMLSFQIGAYFLYLSLRKLQVQRGFAVAISIAVMFLSPQWARLGGHYSLAHGFFLPLLIYLLLVDRTKWNAIFLILLLLITGFIHPYFIAMGSMFVALYLGIELLTTAAIKDWRSWLIRLLIVVLPLILFQGIIAVTDPVVDRPDVPYGFLYFRATFTSIILPLYADYAIYIMRLFPGWVSFSNEGFFYIGAAALIGSVVGGLIWLVKVLMGKLHAAQNDLKPWILLLASIPVMLLSIGMPFTIEGFEHYLDHTGPLQQFRGIGRFAFVFFYAINLFAFALIAKAWPSHKLRYAVLSVLLLVMGAELLPYRKHIIKNTVSSTPVRTIPTGINPQSFDAILPIPYFHVGSENFGTRHTEYIAKDAMQLSLGTGLPLVGVQMSRTSLSQTVQLLQLTGEHLKEHPFAERLSDEVWLLLVDQNRPAKITEQRLLEHAEQVGQHEQYKLYRFPVSAFKAIYTEALEATRSKLADALLLSAVPDSVELRYESYDEAPTSLRYRGEGALSFDRKDWTALIPKGTQLKDDGAYELSFWVRYKDSHAVNTQVWFWERKAGEDVQFDVSEVAHHVVAFDGDWALCSIPIVPHEDGSTFELLLHRDEPMTVWVDEVLLRPLHLDVHTADGLNLNNRYYKPIGEAAVDLANIEP